MIWKWMLGNRGTEENSGKFDEVIRALQANSRPCVLLRNGGDNSKLGGLPDCLSADEWPSSSGGPLSFLAQLDLAEIRQAGGPEWLPADGKMLFFYDTKQEPWGFDPSERDGWRVIHQPPAAIGSDPGGAHLPPELIFPEKRLFAIAGQSLPDASFERIGIDLQELTDTEFDRLYDAEQELYQDFPAHQVGGFPSPIQGDTMELEAQLASNGIYCGEPSAYSSPRAKELSVGQKDWLLLLQLDSDEDVDMVWGDGGRLYFWIREQDARAGDFSNVWLVLQCS